MKCYCAFIALFCLVLLGNAERYNVIFEGDSLTAHLSSDFAGQTFNELGIQGTYTNHGSSGAKMCGDIASDSAEIDALYDVNYDENIVVLWAGSNDIELFSEDQIERALADWCNGRKAAGFRVIVSTITPRAGKAEKQRKAVNSFIRTHWRDFADGITDPGDNATLANYNDAKYYIDGVHMTHEGATIVAVLAKTTILDVIHNLPKRCTVSGRWLIKFNDSKSASMDLVLWVSGKTVMGYGTITEGGAKNSAKVIGSVNSQDLTLVVKENQKEREFDLDLFVINCGHAGTYVLKSGERSVHEGKVTAVKQ